MPLHAGGDERGLLEGVGFEIDCECCHKKLHESGRSATVPCGKSVGSWGDKTRPGSSIGWN